MALCGWFLKNDSWVWPMAPAHAHTHMYSQSNWYSWQSNGIISLSTFYFLKSFCLVLLILMRMFSDCFVVYWTISTTSKSYQNSLSCTILFRRPDWCLANGANRWFSRNIFSYDIWWFIFEQHFRNNTIDSILNPLSKLETTCPNQSWVGRWFRLSLDMRKKLYPYDALSTQWWAGLMHGSAWLTSGLCLVSAMLCSYSWNTWALPFVFILLQDPPDERKFGASLQGCNSTRLLGPTLKEGLANKIQAKLEFWIGSNHFLCIDHFPTLQWCVSDTH